MSKGRRLIDKLRVGLWWYRLVAEDEIKDDDGEGLMGQCRHMEREIAVSRKAIGVPGGKNTLWHETVHALNYQLDLGLGEAEVGRLAHGLESVLTDNPDFMGLCERLKEKNEQEGAI